METDRNLLFGVLALQADLIDAQQFVEICSLWTTRKNVPMAELLLERGWILAADREHVDYLLERKLHKHGGDLRASLAAVGDDIKRSLASVDDADIRRSLAEPAKPRTAELMATVDYVDEPCQRYRRTSLHASGGIGRVWLAHDSDLGRNVALKEIRPEGADDPTIRARFLQEARITGQLEHPGIVPVYELNGGAKDQQPFYTMRFVKGRTLSEAAQTYHAKRLAGQAQALDLLKLLNAFVAVSNTVAYAHARGVVHRDLKGQNVVLGDFGEVVVLDWGLAKLVDQTEGEASCSSALGNLELAGDMNLTVQGQTMGTPGYMAPEQAEGRPDLIDCRTDVYGLGAILYEILTGRPPFIGEDTREVLRKVREEEPAAPSQLCAELPAALERVCLRALSKQSSQRYASATELGHEVQVWQEVQRQQAEEALRASEALYHSLVETLPLSVWRKDMQGRFTFANQRFCESFGPLEKLLGKTDFDLFPAELAAKYRQDDARVIATGTAVETTEEHVTASGERRYVQVVKTPIVDSRGECRETQGIFWDLTARKRMEEELRASEERYRSVIAAMQDGIVLLDADGGIRACNASAERILGLSADQLMGRSPLDPRWGAIGEDGSPFPDEARPPMVTLRTGQPCANVILGVRKPDGALTWLSVNSQPLFQADGTTLAGVAASFEDISERKQIEERLQRTAAELATYKEQFRHRAESYPLPAS